MIKRKLAIICLAAALCIQNAAVAFADTTTGIDTTTMESCGAYLSSGGLWIAVMVTILLFWLVVIPSQREMSF